MRASHASRVFVCVALALLAAVAMVACGGSGTAASASPSTAPGSTISPPSATPPSTASGPGTIAFTKYTKRSLDVYVVHSDGTGLRRLAEDARGPAWSPDGSKIAFVTPSGVYIMNADGSGRRFVTSAPASGWAASLAWSPDGTRIVFSDAGGLAVVNADGSGRKRVITASSGVYIFAPAWAPDGRILFGKRSGDLGEICSLDPKGPIDPDGQGWTVVAATASPPSSSSFSLSPDGKWLAIWDEGSSRLIRTPAGGSGTAIVLVDGLSQYLGLGSVRSTWSPDGSRIALGNDSRMWQVPGSALYLTEVDGARVWKVPNTDNAYDPAWRPQ
jgi:Tol biopolymer transport system component